MRFTKAEIPPQFKGKKVKPKTKLLLGFSLGIVFIALMSFLFFKDYSRNITQEEFQSLLANASKFQVDKDYLYFYNQGKVYRLLRDEQTIAQVKEKYPIDTKSSYFWLFISLGILALLILGAFFFKRFKKQALKPSPPLPSQQPQMPNHSPITPIQPNANIKLSSLAGIEMAKTELLEIIDYLKNPKKYTSLGLRMPKGVLLVGPPGVGKTMLAKALASEAGIPFFYQSGSSFAQIFVGSGAKKVQELFSQAKACSEAIIFIDEIDSVGKIRGEGRSDEREATLNQLLTEIDGFHDSSNLIIFAATNKPEILDPALLRSGRFDRKIYIDLPTLQERAKIFELYLQNKTYDFPIAEIAKDCAGFSGAMIENLINEAGLLMLRQGLNILTLTHLQQAKQNLLFSLKKAPSLNANQREILSLYQSSKAFYAFQAGILFDKVALWDEESIYQFEEFLSKTELFNLLKFYLSANEALKLFKNEPYTCASQDLAEAKNIARDFMDKYGMGGSLFGGNIENLITQAQEELKPLLLQNQHKIFSLSDLMLQKEHLTPVDLREIL